MAEFVMPSLGADMTHGTLLTWLKKPGDRLERGDIIAEVDTDKGVIEVEVFVSGVLEKTLVEPDSEVPVGTPLAIIRQEGEAPSAVGEPVTAAEAPSTVRTPPAVSINGPVTSGREETRLRVSPAARKLAQELGLDLASIKGSGPNGRIQREDVETANRAFGETSALPPPAEALDRRARMRRTISAAMARSKREIPHYYLGTTIDMGRALAWLSQENQRRTVADRLLYGVLLLKAVALALREFPELNAVWEGDQVMRRAEINVGVAISLRNAGLVAPALLSADQQSIGDLMNSFRDLVKRARAGSLRSSELADATVTVTNLGEQGVETVFGVIYFPQVALVGFGSLVERAGVVEHQIVARPQIYATLSADHRVSDGHRGGLFLNRIDRFLQEPEKL